MDYINKIGRLGKIDEEIVKSLEVTQKEAREILQFLLINRDFLDSDEFIEELGSTNSDEKALVVANGMYHINVKLATITVVAFILDILVAKGVLSKILSLSGADSKAVVKISSENGYRCILKEILLEKHVGINENVLEKNSGECIHNEIICKFYKNGKCVALSEDVLKILFELSEMGICRRLENGFYKIK